jgi:hypothetical protein
MGPVVIFAIFSVGMFVALLLFMVESPIAKVVLLVAAAAAWLIFGMVGVMVVTAVLSIGILIADKMPTISKL